MHESGCKPDAFAPCICAELRRASRAVSQLYDLVLAPSELRITQFIALKSMYEAGEIAQCRYAREHGIAVETLSRRFSSLRQKGLVEMRRGAHHGERIYKLTPKGEQAFLATLPYWRRAQDRLHNSLGEADWRALLQLCDRVCQAAQEAEQFRTKNQIVAEPDISPSGQMAAD